jgi:hypothetical protein
MMIVITLTVDCYSDFYSFAPGLKEFVQVSSDDDEENTPGDDDDDGSNRQKKEVKTKPARRQQKKTQRVDNDFENDDDNLNTSTIVEPVKTARTASSRASKVAAMSKLQSAYDPIEEEA